MPLGQGIAEMWNAVQERIELAGHGPTWDVTAGSFESALGFARERFGEPVVLARRDRVRWWPRVTITVTTDRALATSAPRLDDIATPPVPAQRQAGSRGGRSRRAQHDMPLELEAIFAHQEQLRLAKERVLD